MTIEIQTKNLIIKKPEINDLKSLVEQLHNWEISKWLVNVPYPYRIKDGKKVASGFIYSSNKNSEWMTIEQLQNFLVSDEYIELQTL